MDMGKRQSDADREKAEREHAAVIAAIGKRNADRLEAWRLSKLIKAGLTAVQAETVLTWPQVGYRVEEVLQLLKKGCAPGLALDLMRPDTLPASAEAAR